MDVVYASTNASIPLEAGMQARVRKGDHWPADDPLVTARPELFSTDPRYGLQYTRRPAEMDEPPVEAATAAPGERRATVRPPRRG